jgi:LysR family transcriptional regulator, regulator of abg operon
MKLSQLRDVVAVAERGSLRAAARHLGLAQPAITRSIQEIERELGVALFERQAKGMVPTPMGELFVRRAKAVQGELLRARDEIDQLRGQTTGRVSVGLSTVSHIALLPRALDTFRGRYPEVFLDFAEGLLPTMETALKDGNLDFYVGPLPETQLPKEFAVEKLFDNERVVLARKNHPLAHATSLRELVDADWITTSITVQHNAELGPLFERHGLPAPKIRMLAHSALTMIVAAASSDLLTMLPKQWCEFPWTSALLQVIAVKDVLPAPAMHIVRRARLPLTPAAEYLCDLLRRAARQQIAKPRELTRTEPRKKSRGKVP